MIGSPAGPGGASQRGLWPLAAAPAPTASFSTEGLSKYGVYSLFPGGPTFGSALYSHASTIGRFASGHIQQSSGNTFHAAHKVSDSLFSATGYTFGAPTPPPGSPYSPIPVAQLELLAKGFTNSNIIIQQPADFPTSPKKLQQIAEKRCDEKCCSLQRLQKVCHCGSSPVKKIHELNGCSRTNPIEWNGVNVKKEPGLNPCQVAEITTSVSPIVKVEVASPIQKSCDQNAIIGNAFISNTTGHIPVGIAARQRVQQELIASPSLPPVGLLATVNAGGGAQIKEISRIAEIDNIGTMASMAANASGTGPQGGTLLQCTDDRSTALAAWQVGGNQSQAVATPTLWQYPAPVPVEPMVPLPVPSMPPVGFQLVRDPTTGGLLLLPTTGIAEPMQQTLVWPSYPQPSSVLLPSISSLPPPPLQLLSSASSDYLSSSTTLHQHTQTHSTRLVAVTTDTKRKLPMQVPTTTLIKIETDGTLDQTKTLQAVSTIANSSGTMFADPPLVTTHLIYQHPTNLLLSQTSNSAETACRSQATSPVAACLTPPPDTVQLQAEEQLTLSSAVQDASNQTDTPLCSEDDNTTQTIADELPEDKCKSDVETKARGEHLDDTTGRNEELVEPEPITTAPLPQEVTIVEDQKEEEVSAGKNEPDLSGLELLSNSIVEFEICRHSVEDNVSKADVADNESNSSEASGKDTLTAEEAEPKKVEDNLGGLDLLCALAEQRIREECIENPSKTKDRDKERKREKRKSKKHSLDEPKRKKVKSEKRHSSDDRERQRRKKGKRASSDRSDSEKQERELCLCKFKSYKTPESEQEARKFLASKSQSTYCCNREWPCMNAMELDMRMRLADLQRQYREKQKELSKLKTRKHSHSSDCPKKKSRKKSTHSDRSTPPPQLDKMDVPINPTNDLPDLLKPPKLCAMTRLESYSQSDCDSSPEKHSSSKKRKVGRPKKVTSSDGEQVTTETIVAKKPKNNFVEYLLAAKEKLKQQNKEYPDATPPRYVEETYTHKLKKIKNNNTITMDDIKSSKIRPQLKAEATVKTYFDDDNNEYESEMEEEEGEEEQEEAIGEVGGVLEENTEDEEDSGIQEEQEVENLRTEEEDKDAPALSQAVNEVPNPCTLTESRLEVDKLRVLTAMGGLFYAGHLNAVEPPDVYSITLDGERGNRPHIMSREEILRDAIVEISPKSTEDLPAGTRLCAYWSQQYRCLYPGSAAEPGTPDPHLDGKFVSVEFDDGDSGRIALEDIRLLPPNYPIMEYDPNPLLSLCKRKRRTSTSVSTEEKRQPTENIKPQPELKCETVKPVMEEVKSEIEKLHKEKKRLKKKKRDKLKQKILGDEDKKKRRKHKCTDEHCKHRKHHKKHKKHRKRHEKNKLESEAMKPHLATILEEQNEEDANSEEVEENRDIDNQVDDDESSKQDSLEDFPAYEIVANPEDEVTMDDILEATKNKKSKKIRDRQESCESRSKMSAFLPARQLWHWSGKGYKRPRAKGKSKKCFYKAIQRGKEAITVGDSAVFLSTGRPDRPYIGRIEAMWELCGTMVVKVKWFYHPEETVGCPTNLQYPGALFESPHVDENDVQTISHKCEVLPLNEYTERLGDDPQRYASIYDNNDIYYLAGYYDPTSNLLKMEPGIPFTKSD